MNKTVLVIGDTHLPFEHPGYLSFCKRIHDHFKCTDVVHIGDLVDNHAISYHEHDPDGWSPADEMRIADQHLKKWFKTFPEVMLCRGNHDRLVDRKSKTIGLPSRAFKDFREIWNLPKGWKDDFEFNVDGVRYLHGNNYSSISGIKQIVDDNRCSCVFGHAHSVAGVVYTASNHDIAFGMAVGCGIDRKAYAFEYGREDKRKPILGCGVVFYTKRGINAQFIPMDLS